MSSLVLSGLLFLLNLLGMMALMMNSKRHSDKFHRRLSFFLSGQKLRWLGIALLTMAFLLTYTSYQAGYFVVMWFASLTVSAGMVYLLIMVYEQLARTEH